MEREKVVVVVVILFVVVEGGGVVVVVVDDDADEAATAAVVSDWHKTLSRVESKKVKQWYLTSQKSGQMGRPSSGFSHRHASSQRTHEAVSSSSTKKCCLKQASILDQK